MKFYEVFSSGKSKSPPEEPQEAVQEPSHIGELMAGLKDEADQTQSEFDQTVRVFSHGEVRDELEREQAVDEGAQPAEEIGETSETSEDAEQEADLPEVSSRMADFQAFAQINAEVDKQLRLVAERLLLSRRTWALAKPYVEQLQIEIGRADLVEDQAAEATREIAVLRKTNEATAAELAAKIGELAAANSRIAELRRESSTYRHEAFEAKHQSERLRAEAVKATSKIAQLRAELELMTTQLERESVARQNAVQARNELHANYSKLQQTEAQTRNSAIEISLQNEKLMAKLPELVARHEELSGQISSLNREKGELQNRLLAAQDTITQMQSEVRTLESQAASEAFSARTELEVSQGETRTALHAKSELELRLKEAQAELNAAAEWRQKGEHDIAILERELDKAKREHASAMARLSDLNVHYMSDLLALDQEREQGKQSHQSIEMLQAENRRLAKFETLLHSAEDQIEILRNRIRLLSAQPGAAVDGEMQEAAPDEYDPDEYATASANPAEEEAFEEQEPLQEEPEYVAEVDGGSDSIDEDPDEMQAAEAEEDGAGTPEGGDVQRAELRSAPSERQGDNEPVSLEKRRSAGAGNR